MKRRSLAPLSFFAAVSTYRCMSTAVTDIERYNEVARELYQP